MSVFDYDGDTISETEWDAAEREDDPGMARDDDFIDEEFLSDPD